jgi:hypothetical protein
MNVIKIKGKIVKIKIVNGDSAELIQNKVTSIKEK